MYAKRSYLPPHAGWQHILESQIGAAALLSSEGDILGVNTLWQQFARENNGDPERCGVGENYFDFLPDEPETALLLVGLTAVLSGARDQFSHDYECHAPWEYRYFRLFAKALPICDDGSRLFLILHLNITEQHAKTIRDANFRDFLQQNLGAKDTFFWQWHGRSGRIDLPLSIMRKIDPQHRERISVKDLVALMPTHCQSEALIQLEIAKKGHLDKMHVDLPFDRLMDKRPMVLTLKAHIERTPDGQFQKAKGIVTLEDQAKQDGPNPHRAILESRRGVYQSLFKSAPFIQHITDPDGIIMDVSQGWLDHLGYRREEVVGCEEKAYRAQANDHQTQCRVFEDGRDWITLSPDNEGITYWRTRLGKIVPMQEYSVGQYSEEAGHLRNLVQLSDMSESLSTRDHADRLEHWIDSFIDNNQYAMLIMASDYVIERANPKAVALLNWPQSELLGHDVKDIFPETIQSGSVILPWCGNTRSAIQADTIPELESQVLWLRSRRGHKLPVMITLTVTLIGKKEKIILEIKDISGTKN